MSTSTEQHEPEVPRADRRTRVVDLLARTWHGVAGVALWALHLATVYVAVRIACVQGVDARWWSSPRTLVVVATAVLGVASVAVTWASWRAWRARPRIAPGDEPEATRFVTLTSLLVNVVMLYAVLFEGVGAFFLEGC